MLQGAKTFWERIRSSLWALPVLMIAAAVIAAILTLSIRLDIKGDPGWFLYSGTARDASGFLNSLVTSMITMATLVISITMVVLTLAAQALGPRLIQKFMADRRTQTVIGLFIATVIYLLLVMRATNNDSDGAPNLAITIGTALVLLSVMSLPVFVHHLARSIIADVMIDHVGAALDRAAVELLPDRSDENASRQIGSLKQTGAPVRIPGGGYITAIDFGHLVAAASKANATLELGYRAGHHTLPGCAFAWVSPPSAVSDEIKEALRASVWFGSVRTSYQDLEFSIRQLVEISLRALSPGVNDPYTALAGIDRLALSIREIMLRGPSQSCWEDNDGFIRVVVPVSTFDGVIDAAFNEIRQVGTGQPAILIRLAEKFGQLAEVASAEQRKVFRTHLQLVLDAGQRTIKDEYDLEALRERVERALDLCGTKSAGVT